MDTTTPFDKPKGFGRISESEQARRLRLQQREALLVARAAAEARATLAGRDEVPVEQITVTAATEDGLVTTSDGRTFALSWLPKSAFDHYRYAVARATEQVDHGVPLIIEAQSPFVTDVDPHESRKAREALLSKIGPNLSAHAWEQANTIEIEIPGLGTLYANTTGEMAYVGNDGVGEQVSFDDDGFIRLDRLRSSEQHLASAAKMGAALHGPIMFADRQPRLPLTDITSAASNSGIDNVTVDRQDIPGAEFR